MVLYNSQGILQDNIIILDGSQKAHINGTLDTLGEIRRIRDVPQRIWKSFDQEFINEMLQGSYNSKRNQVDVFRIGENLSKNRWLHGENSDALKILLLDQDLYDSRNPRQGFGMGVYFPFERSGNHYIISSTARAIDESHWKHILAHEIGHAFGAPDSNRTDIYESLGNHCIDRNCTMHQELNVRDCHEQSQRLTRIGRLYCPNCERDIRRIG